MIGIVLIAVGAILVWAIHTSASSVNLHTVGWILMAVGFVEMLFEIALFDRFRRWF